ncbi:hypothetical protein SAMN05444412_11313 [Rhodonellum ikkaensis]|uniref:Uncharacterized protein n=1 Tax=Rhodonellum ikkaensis TaxID=336829 RepID=A0A1H3ST06_9BACT|nr:hypothetical protein SAMN05444412_11313 [Rhodonellum ikkaensis]
MKKSMSIVSPYFKYFMQGFTVLFFNNRYGIEKQPEYFQSNKNWTSCVRYWHAGFYYFPTGSIYINRLENLFLLVNVT